MWYEQHQLVVPSPSNIILKLQTSQSAVKLKYENKEQHIYICNILYNKNSQQIIACWQMKIGIRQISTPS